MKILLYNIAYGTGNPGGELKRVLSGHHFILAPERPFRKIRNFLTANRPDVICLIEADIGSRRTGHVNQVQSLAEHLGYRGFFRQKYAPLSLLRRLPYLRHQANAILSREESVTEAIDFFPRGAKKLILTSRTGGITIVLVHLALGGKVRRSQLEYLAATLPVNEPLVVAGDFNTFGGAAELEELLRATGLRSANRDHQPSYPAWAPFRELDYLLLSPQVRLTGFQMPRVFFSDHLPLIAEVELTESATAAHSSRK